MKNLNKFVYLLIIFHCIKSSLQAYVIYHFKKSTKEKKIYPENLLQNDLEITIPIGTPPQNIDLNLRSKVYPFFITSSKVDLPYKTFNETQSKTLIKIGNKPEEYGGQEFSAGNEIYESIIINGREIKNISLILATSIVYKQSGALGLRLVDSFENDGDLSFIYQIKHLANLDNYAFTLKYDNDEKGELIIGSYPHFYDKKFKEQNFVYTRAGVIGKNVDWVLDFDFIRYNNKTINSIAKKSLIKIEYGLIQAPYNLKKYFNDNFFNNKCKERFDIMRNIYIIHCDKNFEINNFKNLSFVLKDVGYEFVLTYKDLFIEQNNEYIFSIVFDNKFDNSESNWILGKPFMKKYQLVFDLERKIIGLYKENQENNDNEKTKNNYVKYIILLIVLSIIFIILLIYLIYIIKKQRKHRAYELNDDNFDYIPSDSIQ